jgi:hypothetical protein
MQLKTDKFVIRRACPFTHFLPPIIIGQCFFTNFIGKINTATPIIPNKQHNKGFISPLLYKLKAVNNIPVGIV